MSDVNYKQSVQFLEAYVDATRDLIDPENPILNGVEQNLQECIKILKEQLQYKDTQLGDYIQRIKRRDL